MFEGLGKDSGQTIYMSAQIGPHLGICRKRNFDFRFHCRDYMSAQIGPHLGICRKRNFDFRFHCRDTALAIFPYVCIGKPFICNVCYVSGRGQRDDLYQIC